MKNRTTWLVLGVVAAFLAVWLLFLRADELTTTASLPEQLLPPELEAHRSEAFDLQRQRQWCRAQSKWQELVNELGDRPEYSAAAEEARANLAMARQRCEPGTEMIGEGVPLEVTPTPQTRITEHALLTHYPAGKTIQSTALIEATGRGSNQKWIVRADAYFAYSGKILVENKVLENTGSMAEFAVSIPEATQIRAVSDESIQLEPPDSPLLQIVWDQAEPMLKVVPYYNMARRLADLVMVADPRLKRTLTAFHKRLKIAGYDLASNREEAQIAARLDALSGHRLRLVYVPGYGVQTIEVLGGELLPKDDLMAFARSSGLLLDYVVSQVLDTNVGDDFEVDARDVVRLIGMKYDVEIQGTIRLRREMDEGPLAVMSLAGGEVVVEALVEGVRRRGTLVPKNGSVKFDRQSFFVTEAQLKWHADLDWFTEDHLLFGTRAIRDLDLRSHYDAEKK